MTQPHTFQIGGRYRTRAGDYTVTAIDGDTLTASFDDGREEPLPRRERERPAQRRGRSCVGHLRGRRRVDTVDPYVGVDQHPGAAIVGSQTTGGGHAAGPQEPGRPRAGSS